MRIVAVLTVLVLLFAAPVGTDPAAQDAPEQSSTTEKDYEEEMEEYVPSEEVSADLAVSFPVDI